MNRCQSRRDVLRGAGVAGGLLLGTSSVGAAPPSGFRAGAARVDASPQQRHLEADVYLGGFGVGPQPSRRATGNHDGVTARALAVATDGEPVVLAALDLPGLGNRQQRAIRERVAAATGVAPDRVLVGVTHTHAGPDFQGLWGGVPESYRSFLVERTSRAVTRAVDGLEPARAFVGSVDAQELASNRRIDDYGTVSTLTALQFRAARGGDTVGTVVNYAAHPTVIGSGNQLVATDFVGPLERTVEAAHGGVAVYNNGAIGDASASAPAADTEYAAAAAYGRALAGRVDDALADPDRVHGSLDVRTTRLRLPIDNCVFKAGFESGLLKPYYDGRTATDVAVDPVADALEGVAPGAADRLREGPEAGGLAIETPVARASLGERRGATVDLLTVPGESVTHLAREWLLPAVDAVADYPILAGLTANSLGYLIAKDRYDDGYEETVSLGPDTAPLYRNAVTDIYDLDWERYERVPPGPENVCPEGQAQFSSYAEEYGPSEVSG